MGTSAGGLIKSAAFMTALTLVNKLLGVFLRLYMSARLGSEGMGLFQLILSVYTLFSTFATAGLTVSVSRLAAERAQSGGEKQLMSDSFRLAAGISAAATAAMLLFADKAARMFLGDLRCAAPLRVLALSMPFMALAACFKGWLIANRRAYVTSEASLFEQAVKFAVTALFLGAVFANVRDTGRLCLGIAAAVTVSEFCSCIFLWAGSAICAKRRPTPPAGSPFTRRESLRGLISVAAPIALSVCVTSLLHTCESVLVPKVFQSFSGGDRSYALSQFGMIRGMVIPLLFFPFAFLASLVSVYTPEISRLNLLADKEPLKRRVSSLLGVTALFSAAAGGLFFFLPECIGNAFYPGENTAGAIRLLAAATPFMYVETVCDGVLKATGEQMRTLRYTLINSALRLILIATLVRRFGGDGYLWLLVISNSAAYALCRARVAKSLGVRPGLVRGFLFPAGCAATAGVCARFAVEKFLAGAGDVAAAAAGSAVYLAVFAVPVLLTGALKLRAGKAVRV